MATKLRKTKTVKKTAYDTSAGGFKVLAISFNNKIFHLYSQTYPDIYKRYVDRKDIHVNFSGVKSQKDIDTLRKGFIKRYKDAPTQEQIDQANKEYEIAEKNEIWSFRIQDAARSIVQDLVRAGSNKRISDERYKQIVKYVKDAVRAVANGKNINSVKESMPVLQRMISKFTYAGDTLENLKFYINQFKDQISDIPKDLWRGLIEVLPKKRLSSFQEDAVNDYRSVFSKAAVKNTRIRSDKEEDLTIMLVENKIKEDAIRTFDVLAQQHIDKLKKKDSKLKAQIFKDVSAGIKHKKGLAHQKIVNMYGPVDPVARTVAKIRRNSGNLK